ncbi:nematode resistance protein-like HSPRO2 [Magnolia sinica]|uniref:nematode resistance protein-like HSPRO2 n=1 Tax=Magnolia sinica TaxID=86752 RepID=UPI002659844C|nr:nematode resistance protein-like HSPRO2 [Magnolia sinica]
MVDLDWKAKMVSAEMSKLSPKLSDKSDRTVSSPALSGDLLPSSPSATLAYEQYLRLPELSKLCSSREFTDWKSEALLKPALQALEITFRFISLVLSDPRPYANRNERKRRLEALTLHQIELIAVICEEEEENSQHGSIPIVDLSNSNGLLSRDRSSTEVWKLPGESLSVVSRISEASLLPRLATWQKSEDVARKISFAIECQMQRSPFTLGLGEPNLAGKPNLDYDLICKPSDLHALKKPLRNLENYENGILFTAHQILESWIFTARELLRRISDRIDGSEFEKAASDCWLLERIWKLLSEIEDLHLLMDPDDFLRLKNQLAIKASNESEAFCFRSTALIELTRSSKDLKHKVPSILGVEVDPKGGPRVQEAAMRLFHGKGDVGKIHLLQAFQAVEVAVKRFFFGYRQLVVAVMGSLEAKGNRGLVASDGEADALAEMFMEPPYFPSLDGAKTFLGEFWQNGNGISISNGTERRGRKRL